MSATVRMLFESDRDDWLKLYRVYAGHYGVALTETGIAATWGWLTDPDHPVTGLVAEAEGDLVGLAHFRAMPSPLRGQEIGFLDDLVVTPEARGQGVAEALIAAVGAEGRRRGWPVVRWITRDDNYRARAVYDRVATKTDWNTYELNCA